MKKTDLDVARVFERWLEQKFTPAARLPAGFEYAHYNDPDLTIVTDGFDEFVIEVEVLVIRQPKEGD